MYDLIVTNGRIVDGSGGLPYPGEIAIEGSHIVAMGEVGAGEGNQTIDASGYVIAPGFIDIHSHTDLSLLIDPMAQSKLRQGVTTEIGGNCGSSPGPFSIDSRSEYQVQWETFGITIDWLELGQFLSRIEQMGTGINYGTLVGHGTIRSSVIGAESRQATPSESRQMARTLERAMDQGAWGLSTGLIYPPGCWAPTSELAELCKIVEEREGLYATHIRGEGKRLIPAIAEAIVLGVETGVPVQIAHLKASGRSQWGLVEEALRHIDHARAQGVDVAADRYPYRASSTSLSALYPEWAHRQGRQAFLDRLGDPSQRSRMEKEMALWEPEVGWDCVLVAGVDSERNRTVEGLTITEIASRWSCSPFDAASRLVQEEDGMVSICCFSSAQEDVDRALEHPWVMVGSDAMARTHEGPLSKGKPHPRAYGTFPRFIRRYVRERSTLSLAEAVRKMTSLPASRLGLRDRGILAPHTFADLVIFDPSTITDTSDYANPHRYPQGIRDVIVNGELVIKDGELTGARPGRVLRH